MTHKYIPSAYKEVGLSGRYSVPRQKNKNIGFKFEQIPSIGNGHLFYLNRGLTENSLTHGAIICRYCHKPKFTVESKPCFGGTMRPIKTKTGLPKKQRRAGAKTRKPKARAARL